MSRCGGSVWVAALALVCADACGLSDTSERGFGSRQVLHVRDPVMRLAGFSGDFSAVYLATTVAGITTSQGLDAPSDRWLLFLDTGVLQPISGGVMSTQTLTRAPGPDRSLAMLHFPSDTNIPTTLSAGALPPLSLTFFDEPKGPSLTLSGIDSNVVFLGTTREDPIVVGLFYADAEMSVPWAGLPERTHPMPAGINQVVGRDRSGFIGLTAASTTTAPPDAQAFTRYPFDGTPPVEIVPGSLSNYAVVAAPGETIPTGAAVVPATQVNPGIHCPPATADDASPPCLLFYERTLLDGTSRGFVHDLDTGLETALPSTLVSPQGTGEVPQFASGGRDAVWNTWTEADAGASVEIYGWHVGASTVASCAVQPGGPDDGRDRAVEAPSWRPGANQFASVVRVLPTMQSVNRDLMWVLLTGTAGSECHVTGSGPNDFEKLSQAPDGSRFALLELDAGTAGTIYLVDWDTLAQRILPTDHVFDLDFHDPSNLLVWSNGIGGASSFSLLNVDAEPATQRLLADRVRWDMQSSWAWLTPRWVLLADDDSPDDGSFSLDVLDIETGERRPLSHGVVEFQPSWSTPPADATELVVVYRVRGRTATAQDGFWVAHLPLSEFSP